MRYTVETIMMPTVGVFKRQIFPLILSLIACGILIVLIYLEILVLNGITVSDISTHVRLTDILIGFTIYIKTSIDFAIFIGNLMNANPGWKNRISIELGTAFGNGLGTMLILLIWTFFKEVEWLLAIMILLAAVVLFKLAEDGLEHAKDTDRGYPSAFKKSVTYLEKTLEKINKLCKPLMQLILPDLSMNSTAKAGFWALFSFAFFVPFVLGLDDFAGYVPLFSVVNILGFSIGVFLAHSILNILLYISPTKTIKAVKNPYISFFGSIAFVGLALLGFYEAGKILFH